MPTSSRRLRRSVLVAPLLLAGGAVVGAASMPASTGCTTHQCDADCVSLGGPSPDGWGCAEDPATYGNFGNLAQPDAKTMVWETSSAATGTGIDFPGQRKYVVWWPPAMKAFIDSSPAGWVVQIDPYVSTTPTDPGYPTSVNAAGELAEFGGIADTGFQIVNPTCTEYYLRIVVTVTVP